MIKLIAETAWHHEGDFKFMKSLVDKIAKETQADYIKLHITLDFDEYMYKDHPAYNMLKGMTLTKEQWETLIHIVLANDKKPMLLYNDTKAVQFGQKFNPEIIEIHSVCLNDIKLLKQVKQSRSKDTKVVIGIGGTEINEVENAIQILDTENIVLMHGFQNYPTKYSDINFRKIRKLMQLYPSYRHGYADHTAWDEQNNELITIMGAALGMDYIEKHVTIKPGIERIDWQASIAIEQFNQISHNLEVLKSANGNGSLALNSGEKAYSVFGPNKKAAILVKDLNKGEKLTENKITFKRTGQQTDLSQVEALKSIGKKITKNLQIGHCLTKQDIEN